MLNSKKEKDSIYEIYRACRLCGGGAGYKMPIIQNIIELDDSDVDLKQKIRDCVQIEVHQDDKMPPLICELCVDKVNDFYEFLDMCRQTNKRTRLRLGLPPQSLSKGAPDAGDCILGLTEPVFVNNDSDGEPLTKHKKVPAVKVKKEPVVKIKIEDIEKECTTRNRKQEPTPQRVTRNSRSKDDDLPIINLKENKAKSTKVALKPILKKENTQKNDIKNGTKKSAQNHRPKRSLELERSMEIPVKRVRIVTKPVPPINSKATSKPSLKTSPRVKSQSSLRPTRAQPTPPVAPVRSPSPPKDLFRCQVCEHNFKSPQARSNHLKTHTVTFTNPTLACNPCGLWFSTPEETASHHKKHQSGMPYSCTRCYSEFKELNAYDRHFPQDCIPDYEAPDLKCDVCWHMFATHNLFDSHKCLGEDYRPGGKCAKCNKSYALQKNLKKHESTCTAKKKGELKVSKQILNQLKPIQVRVSRCDPLLAKSKHGHYNVSDVAYDFGLDRNCYYPYISKIGLKSRFSGMVDIHDDFKRAFCSEDYVHWDSDDSESEDEITLIPKSKKINSLAALTLKTIFSQRLLGKVPRKKRKVKIEKAFDSLLADDINIDIGNIIDNLGDDDDDDDGKSNDGHNKDISVVSKSKDDSFNKVQDIDASERNQENINTDVTKENGVDYNSMKDDLCKYSKDFLTKSNEVNDTKVNETDKNNDGNDKNVFDRASYSDADHEGDKSININTNDSQEPEKNDNDLSSTDHKSDTNDLDSNNISVNDKDSQVFGLNSDVPNYIESNLNSKCKDDSLSDKNESNEKLDLDVLCKSASSKVSLGLNDFSFDTL